MKYRDVFTKLNSDLTSLNPNEMTIVTYQSESHLLYFRQMTKLIGTPYLSPFFFKKSGFRVGCLSPQGLNKLKYQLNELLKTEAIDKGLLIPDLRKLGTDWYRSFSNQLPEPQKVIELRYVDITSKLAVWLACTHYNANSKIIYKVAKNEKKINSNTDRVQS